LKKVKDVSQIENVPIEIDIPTPPGGSTKELLPFIIDAVAK
jgi:hypothetical protein